MPTDRIFSRDLDLQGFRLRESILDPVPESALVLIASGLDTEDEGYQVFDTTNNRPTYWDGTDWVSWPEGGVGTGDVVNITYTDLQNLTGGSTTATYYMTTPGKEGLWRYTGTAADQSTDNEGTIIVTADLKIYERAYDGTLDIRWFGGVADFVAAGTAFTGTNNTTALNKMWAAAGDNQPMVVPDVGTGWLFSGSMSTLGNAKIANLTFLGDTYHTLATATTPFINIVDAGKEHKIYHKARAFGKLGIPEVSKAAYDAGTGPDWNTFTGIFMRLLDSVKPDLEINFTDGFAEALHLEGGTTAASGVQEITVKFKWMYRNKYGIRLVVSDGSGFVDKCNFYGGRIMGQFPISFEGNAGGASKTGVFTANNFYNILIEAAESGITGTGVIRYNSFIACQIEGGVSTGIFGPNKIDLGTGAFGNSFIGNETLRTDWFNNPGDSLSIYGTSIVSTTDVFIGSAALGGISNGRTTVIGSQGLSSTTKSTVSSNIDLITFLGVSPISAERRDDEFAKVRLNGVDQAVQYKGRVVNITTAGNTTLVPPTGYVRLAAGTGNVVLMMEANQIYDGSSFILEQTGTGTVELKRISDNVTFLPAQILTTGYYYVRYFNAGAFQFVPTKIGGAGGAGTLTFIPVGAAPNADGGTISGSNINLQPASSSFPGVVTTATQQFGGNKEIIGDFAVRKTTATSTTIENTSVTESTLTSLNVLNVVGGAFLKVNNNSIAELGRKDNTATAAYILSNGKTFGSGRQWSLGINPSSNHFTINNQGLAANALTIQSANSNVRIGTLTTDPGVKLQVDGDFRTTGQFFLGSAASDPGGATNGQGYYNNSTNKARLYQNNVWVDWVGSGGGGGGVNAIDEVGPGDDNAATIDGTTLTLHIATSTQPGLWAVGTQTLPGIKTFTGTHIFRTNSVTSGTAPFKIVEGSALMNVQENGAVERFGDNLWFTGSVERRAIATSHNVVTFFNKTWQGNAIDKTYISGTGAGALQTIRRNAANTDWEWFTPGSGGSTETASNGLTKTGLDIQLGGLLTQATTITGGGSRPLSLGTSGSRITTLTVAASNFVIDSGIQLTKIIVSNTAFTFSQLTNYIECSNTLTANRVLTLPTPDAGKIIIIHNLSTNATFNYSIAATYRLGSTGATVSNLGNNTVIQLLGTGTIWVAMNK